MLLWCVHFMKFKHVILQRISSKSYLKLQSKPSKKATLAEIYEYLMKKDPWFRESYTGWKNSIRKWGIRLEYRNGSR